MTASSLLLTCEHGGNGVPPQWRPTLAPLRNVLSTHRGWDPGALIAARAMARRTRAPLVASTTTRLLVDLNRSPHNPRVFSSATRTLSSASRASLLEEFHTAHWHRVGTHVRSLLRHGELVVHVGVHSFTPVLDGRRREFDLALLYDPKREREVAFCDRWLDALAWSDPTLRLRRNAPYRGTDDGLVTALRRALPARRYVGIELEINQSWPLGDASAWRRLVRTMAETLATATAAD